MSGREATAPLLTNGEPRDSFDEDERALLIQEETKQIRRVCGTPSGEISNARYFDSTNSHSST